MPGQADHGADDVQRQEGRGAADAACHGTEAGEAIDVLGTSTQENQRATHVHLATSAAMRLSTHRAGADMIGTPSQVEGGVDTVTSAVAGEGGGDTVARVVVQALLQARTWLCLSITPT